MTAKRKRKPSKPKRTPSVEAGAAAPAPGPVVVIDTREQLPYEFSPFVIGTLATGDYSLLGHEHRIAIERKTKADAYSTIGQGRERFVRELRRMAELEYAAIVVECSLVEFLSKPDYVRRLTPRAAIRSLISWSLRYGVHLHFAGDRAHAEALVMVILEKWWKYNVECERQEATP